MHRATAAIFTILILPTVLCWATPTTSPATSPSAPQGQSTVVRSMILPEVFQSAGLKKLSAQEMANLNAWLEAYIAAEAQIALRTGMAVNPSLPAAGPELHPNPLEVIESQIDGDFEGWDGSTTVRLQNGQVWKQRSVKVAHAHAQNPGVIIFRQMGQYRMKVEGVPGVVVVKRIK